MREYCCSTSECQSKIGYQLCQLCFGRSSRATRASRATNLRPSGSVALSLAESRQRNARGVALSREPPKLCPLRYTRPRAAKATAGVAVVCKTASITRATAVVRYTLLASGARRAPRWLAATSNSTDSKGSVSAVVRYCCVVRGMGVLGFGGVLRGGMSDAMGSKITGSSNFFDRVFRLEDPFGILSRKKLSRKSHFWIV